MLTAESAQPLQKEKVNKRVSMPYDEVMSKYKSGSLRSGSGDKVNDRKQAIAIMLSEKRKADAGDTEYQSANDHDADDMPPKRGIGHKLNRMGRK